MIVHSGDFKVDLTPIDEDTINLARLGQLGQDGVLLLLCESTNADRPGYTPTEKTVGQSFEQIFFSNKEKPSISLSSWFSVCSCSELLL